MEFDIKDILYLIGLVIGLTGCYYKLKSKIDILEVENGLIKEDIKAHRTKLDIILPAVLSVPSGQ